MLPFASDVWIVCVCGGERMKQLRKTFLLPHMSVGVGHFGIQIALESPPSR